MASSSPAVRAEQHGGAPERRSAAPVADEDDASSCAVALNLEHVLESSMASLDLHERMGAAAFVAKRFSTAAAHATAAQGIIKQYRYGPYFNEVGDLAPFLSKYGNKLISLDLHKVELFEPAAPAPFIAQLSHLTRLELCCSVLSAGAIESMATS